MTTPEQLSAVLMAVNVKQLSDRSGLSEKTIYRLRNRRTSPTLRTVNILQAAVAAIQSDESAPVQPAQQPEKVSHGA